MTDNRDDPPEQPTAPIAGLLEVGRVGRAHGLGGDVLVHLSTNRDERVEVGSVLHTERGPLTIARSRPHKRAHLVHFEGISTRDAAERIGGLVLWAEPMEDPDVVWAHEVIGAMVVDQHGREHGPVRAMEANPASDLLVLESGRMVPVRFVTDLIPRTRVRVEVPRGLL